MGPLALFHRNTVSTARRRIKDTDAEVERFQEARLASIEQLKDMYEKAVQKVGEEEAAVFEVHQMMLDDDDYIDNIVTLISQKNKCRSGCRRNGAAVFRNVPLHG